MKPSGRGEVGNGQTRVHQLFGARLCGVASATLNHLASLSCGFEFLKFLSAIKITIAWSLSSRVSIKSVLA